VKGFICRAFGPPVHRREAAIEFSSRISRVRSGWLSPKASINRRVGVPRSNETTVFMAARWLRGLAIPPALALPALEPIGRQNRCDHWGIRRISGPDRMSRKSTTIEVNHRISRSAAYDWMPIPPDGTRHNFACASPAGHLSVSFGSATGIAKPS